MPHSLNYNECVCEVSLSYDDYKLIKIRGEVSAEEEEKKKEKEKKENRF